MLFGRKKKKIFVALSGGVDSAVSAYLLKKRGHEVFGGFIKGYNVDGCQDREAADAAKVAGYLGIPFYTFDMEKEYERRVVDYLLEGYKKGITPNPDVACNSEIKFGLFYEQAIKLGADAVASGHYAILRDGELYAGRDENKDQSYFLWGVSRDRFSRILFPVGNYTKKKVRRIALKAKLPNALKKDSQGVCFLGKFDFNEFLRDRLGGIEGDVLDVSGNIVGKHYGAHLYTIGQRHGFLNYTNKPLFVISKDVKKNILIAGHEHDEELKTEEFIASSPKFLDKGFANDLMSGKTVRAYGRCRYRQPLFSCDISMKGEHLFVKLKKRMVLFPAPGQSFVAYDSRNKVLGGAVIRGYEV